MKKEPKKKETLESRVKKLETRVQAIEDQLKELNGKAEENCSPEQQDIGGEGS